MLENLTPLRLTLRSLTLTSGLSPSLNSGHTAPLCSAQIAKATSHTRKTLSEIHSAPLKGFK
jgi:hypothetical protein